MNFLNNTGTGVLEKYDLLSSVQQLGDNFVFIVSGARANVHLMYIDVYLLLSI